MTGRGWVQRHRKAIWLALALAMLAGVWSAPRLPSGIYPEVTFPRIGVVVRQGAAPPEVFQFAITRPLEQAMMGVLGIQRVRSRTIRGGADIQLLFAPSTDMWRALQMVQGAVAEVRASLPADARVSVERLSPVAFPILSYTITGPLDPRALQELAAYTIKPVVTRVPGVGRVGLLGGDQRELSVLVDPERAAAAHLSVQAVATRLRAAIPLLAAGRFEQDHTLSTVMASAEARDEADLRSVPVAVDGQGVTVPLSAVATVTEGAADRYFRTSSRHGPAVIMTIARLEGASTPDVSQAVNSALQQLRSALPSGVQIEPVYDQGLLVQDSIASVRDAIIMGVLLCLLVLGAFLRDVRAGLVAALAVPTTLAVTFLAMAQLGQTLNLMSLGGMAVSIGLVVDDAIVIVEAIARKLEQGLPPAQAAREGSQELTMAVIGTTLTTVIVFLPLAFLDGIVGQFFTSLALTLSSAVLISMAMALLAVPLAAASVMRPRPTATSDRLGDVATKVVRWSARHRWVGVAALLLTVAITAWLATRVPSGFMPSCDEGAFVIDYEMPAGTSLSDTAAAAQAVERILRRTPEVESYARRTGAQLNPTTVTLLHTGDFVVRLKPLPRPHADVIIGRIRAAVAQEVPGIRVEFIQILQDMLNDLSGTPRPIEVRVFGPEQPQLERLASDVAARIAQVSGAVDVYDGVERPSSQLTAHIDRDAAARLGVSPGQLSQELRAGLLGASGGAMRWLDRLLPIRVRWPDTLRHRPERLAGAPLAFPGKPVTTWSALTTWRPEAAATELRHEGLQPVVLVTADVEERDLGAVVRDVRARLADLPVPAGYRLEIGGQLDGQRAAMLDLAVVALAGLLLVLGVLVIQFGAFRPALAVLFTAPLSLIGAFAALWWTHIPLNVSALMGCVLLLGLVVKNGILLVEVAEEHLAAGDSAEDAIAAAARRRMRPIAMTSLATLVGLAPLAVAFGAGAEMQQPLAVAVIGGLSVAGALMFVVLPALWVRSGASLHPR